MTLLFNALFLLAVMGDSDTPKIQLDSFLFSDPAQRYANRVLPYFQQLKIPEKSKFYFSESSISSFDNISTGKHVFKSLKSPQYHHKEFYLSESLRSTYYTYDSTSRGLTTLKFSYFSSVKDADYYLFSSMIANEIVNSAPIALQFSYAHKKYFLELDSMRILGDWCGISRVDEKQVFFRRGNIAVIIDGEAPVIEIAKLVDSILTGKIKPISATVEQLALVDSAIAEQENNELLRQIELEKRLQEKFKSDKVRRELVEKERILKNGVMASWYAKRIKDEEKNIVVLRTHLNIPSSSRDVQRIIPNAYVPRVRLEMLSAIFSDSSIFSKTIHPNSFYAFLAISEFKRKFHIEVVHCASREEATQIMLALRLKYPAMGEEKLLLKEIAARTVQNKFKVGDYNMSWFGILGVDLLPEGKSDESYILFLRGNTVVFIKDEDPKKSVLEFAEKIDKLMTGE